MRQLGCLIIVSMLLISGCGLFETKEEGSAQELAWEGMEAFNEGNFKEAIKAFEKLKDWYPFSKFAILAELKIPDSHYKLGQYEEAVAGYEEFESLHPRNEAITYVVFQIGQCYFEQIDTPDRDQTSARKALASFKRLIQQHPNSDYAAKARERLVACLKSLAGHDIEVGKYYYRAKKYEAALRRFQNVVTKYPDVGIHQNALQYIALTEAKLRSQETHRKQE